MVAFRPVSINIVSYGLMPINFSPSNKSNAHFLKGFDLTTKPMSQINAVVYFILLVLITNTHILV
jgi:hypothetical protein